MKVLVAAIAALVMAASTAEAARKVVVKVRGYNIVFTEIAPGQWRGLATGRVIDCTYRGKKWSCTGLN
jgi:hypothetical protein